MRYLNSLVPGSAAMLSAGMDKKETADVYRKMRGEPVEGDVEGTKLVMVLVTPEKVLSALSGDPMVDLLVLMGRNGDSVSRRCIISLIGLVDSLTFSCPRDGIYIS